MNQLLNEIKEILPKEMDCLVMGQNKEQIGVLMKGDVENIAEALFFYMHNPAQENGANIYRIVKMVAMNIVSNRSIYRTNFINSLIEIMPQDDEHDK